MPLANNGGPTLTYAVPDNNLDIVNQGNTDACKAELFRQNDQRGLPRISDDKCDIGAYEVSKPIFNPAPTITFDENGIKSALFQSPIAKDYEGNYL